jgi:HK97 family phage prohead protease
MMEFEARGKHVRLPAEVRAADEGILVEGYAAVFNQETDIGGFFRERIEPGAFSEAIGRDDVVFLINHDGLPLARTRSGTLTLSEDDKGLKISTRLEESDPDVARIVGKMKRGDLDKMSFAFWPEVQEWDDSGDMPVRTIKKASLHDVSIVTTPAYDGTEIGLRSLEGFRKQQAQRNFSAARMRLRMKRDLALREHG